jgi:hypothetical protein
MPNSGCQSKGLGRFSWGLHAFGGIFLYILKGIGADAKKKHGLRNAPVEVEAESKLT